jgi:aldose 1-epimerase
MIREFGKLADGSVVHEISLKKGALEAAVLTYGAVIRDLRFNDRSVVLGFEDLKSYVDHSPFFGAVPGRCANRISNATATIDGKVFKLDPNEGSHQLHGGLQGFSSRIWSLEQSDKGSVLLKYVSADGEEGYPGTVEALCRYTLTGTGALRVKLTATTDKPTLVNLTQHSYFNLDGSQDILGHNLEIAADAYLPVDGDFIPTGEVRNVAWTPYDFREGKKLRRKATEGDVIYDHNFCLSRTVRDRVEFAAALEDSAGDCRMELWTTEPGLQLYDGYKLDIPVPGLGGRNYGPHAGVCLEPQRWPDATNHGGFPNVVLRPGETYSHVSEFRFSAET